MELPLDNKQTAAQDTQSAPGPISSPTVIVNTTQEPQLPPPVQPQQEPNKDSYPPTTPATTGQQMKDDSEPQKASGSTKNPKLVTASGRLSTKRYLKRSAPEVESDDDDVIVTAEGVKSTPTPPAKVVEDGVYDPERGLWDYNGSVHSAGVECPHFNMLVDKMAVSADKGMRVVFRRGVFWELGKVIRRTMDYKLVIHPEGQYIETFDHDDEVIVEADRIVYPENFVIYPARRFWYFGAPHVTTMSGLNCYWSERVVDSAGKLLVAQSKDLIFHNDVVWLLVGFYKSKGSEMKVVLFKSPHTLDFEEPFENVMSRMADTQAGTFLQKFDKAPVYTTAQLQIRENLNDKTGLVVDKIYDHILIMVYGHVSCFKELHQYGSLVKEKVTTTRLGSVPIDFYDGKKPIEHLSKQKKPVKTLPVVPVQEPLPVPEAQPHPMHFSSPHPPPPPPAPFEPIKRSSRSSGKTTPVSPVESRTIQSPRTPTNTSMKKRFKSTPPEAVKTQKESEVASGGASDTRNVTEWLMTRTDKMMLDLRTENEILREKLDVTQKQVQEKLEAASQQSSQMIRMQEELMLLRSERDQLEKSFQEQRMVNATMSSQVQQDMKTIQELRGQLEDAQKQLESTLAQRVDPRTVSAEVTNLILPQLVTWKEEIVQGISDRVEGSSRDLKDWLQRRLDTMGAPASQVPQEPTPSQTSPQLQQSSPNRYQYPPQAQVQQFSQQQQQPPPQQLYSQPQQQPPIQYSPQPYLPQQPQQQQPFPPPPYLQMPPGPYPMPWFAVAPPTYAQQQYPMAPQPNLRRESENSEEDRNQRRLRALDHRERERERERD